MDFLNKMQMIAIGLIFVGGFIMNRCTGYERKMERELKNLKYALIDGGKEKIKKKKSAVGNFLFLIGITTSLGGVVMFFYYLGD